jgi:hypothetical protein
MGIGQVLEGVRRNGSTFLVQVKLAPLVIIGAGLHVLAIVRAMRSIHSSITLEARVAAISSELQTVRDQVVRHIDVRIAALRQEPVVMEDQSNAN